LLTDVRLRNAMRRKSSHLRLVSSARDGSDAQDDDDALVRASGARLRVLLVEDDAAVAAVLTDFIRDSGGEIAAMITSGLASVGAAAGTRPDVIVMDVGLPGMDGIDAAAIIRARHQTPIVLISGRDIRAEATERLGSLEGLELLLKPIERKALSSAIHRALGRSEDF
jgi:CheY-like chemotaxis protein